MPRCIAVPLFTVRTTEVHAGTPAKLQESRAEGEFEFVHLGGDRNAGTENYPQKENSWPT